MDSVNSLQTIDQSTWNRRQSFHHYRHRVPCTYAITVEIEVTGAVEALRRSARKTYPAQIWAIATLVNRHEEFRLSLDEQGEPATWDVVHPSFTIFNPERETFCAVSVPYDADFSAFHARAVDVLATHRSATDMFPQGELPTNSFDISSLPWAAFSGFTLQIDGSGDHFLPIFTLGRYVEREGRTLLPVALQVHHAAVDGFHAARLLKELEELMTTPDWLN